MMADDMEPICHLGRGFGASRRAIETHIIIVAQPRALSGERRFDHLSLRMERAQASGEKSGSYGSGHKTPLHARYKRTSGWSRAVRTPPARRGTGRPFPSALHR